MDSKTIASNSSESQNIKKMPKMLNFSLVGNPNVGKTSLFNRITHSLEHVGNWHGVTIKQTSKQILHENILINITDLPGLYSLTIYSPEEEISRNCILEEKSDLIINVCEVNNLSRNLYLTLQLLELDVPILVVINMMDELKKQGKTLDYKKLEKSLGLCVVPMSAKYRTDAQTLLKKATAYCHSREFKKPYLPYLDKLPVNEIMSIISSNARAANLKPKYAAIKLMENDSFIIRRLKLSQSQKEQLERLGNLHLQLTKARYDYIDKITSGIITKNIQSSGSNFDGTGYVHGYSPLDRIALNKYLAIPIFLAVMMLIFYLTFGLLGKAMSDLLDLGMERLLYQPILDSLIAVDCPLWITMLLCDGIILGVGGILTFLPQIVLLFFFLAMLEDSGYISRVAFMTDGLFRKIGLSGRSVFTMLMGFGCSATAVLTARGLEDETMRKKTVILTPFMSCSARLPVYAIIAGAFFTGGQPFVIMFLYVLGVAVALIYAAIFEKLVKPLKSGSLSFIMEMPPYRIPTLERVLQLIWNNTKVFLVRVGTTVFFLNVIIWVLSNFSFQYGFVTGTDNSSVLEILAGIIAPIFSPLGFGNWKAVTSLLSGIVAKEVVIASIESLGGVNAIFIGEFAYAAALSFLVFTLLYVPCIATLIAIKKEIGTKWMIFNLFLQLLTAYLLSLICYWLVRLLAYNIGLTVGIIIVTIIILIMAAILMSLIKNKSCKFGCTNCKSNCKGKGK